MPVLPDRDEIDFTYHTKNKIKTNVNEFPVWSYIFDVTIKQQNPAIFINKVQYNLLQHKTIQQSSKHNQISLIYLAFFIKMTEIQLPKLKTPNLQPINQKSSFKNHEISEQVKKKFTLSRQKNIIENYQSTNKYNSQTNNQSSDQGQTSIFFSKMKEPKRIMPKISLIKKQQKGSQHYSSQKLIGEKAFTKFYDSYKNSSKIRMLSDFNQQNRIGKIKNKQNPIMIIINLLQTNNFSPRTLDMIKMKGKQSILDLNQLGLGKGLMGPIVSQLIKSISNFQQVNLSSNSIDGYFCQTLINSLQKIKKINLSQNRIGKIGCQRLINIMNSPECSIINLALDDNCLLDYYAAQFLKSLHSYKKLKILSIKKNSLSKKSAFEISNLLKDNQTIQEIYLSWNDFKQKQTNLIMNGLSQNQSVKVFDYSWNRVGDAIQKIQKMFKENVDLLHLDISFCQINKSNSQRLKLALEQNHTLYGVHFQGNSGYIDQDGYLQVSSSQFVHYPLPLIKGFLRVIDSVKPNHHQNYYNDSYFIRDKCWICNSWQQLNIYLPDSQFNQPAIQAYIHFKHQNFKAIKLNRLHSGWEIYKLCPKGKINFFVIIYTQKSKKQLFTSKTYTQEEFNQKVKIQLGKIQFEQVIQRLNIYHNQYQNQPIDSNYQVLVKSLPRNISQIVKDFVKIRRKKKVQVLTVIKQKFRQPPTEIRQIVEPKDYLSKNYIKKCIENDIQSSNIKSIFKDWSTLQRFKKELQKFYLAFAIIFYRTAKYNNTYKNFTVNQSDLIKLCKDLKLLPNTSNSDPKIFLKVYQILSFKNKISLQTQSLSTSKKQEQSKSLNEVQTNKCVNRPQFLQFLIKISIEKSEQIKSISNQKIGIFQQYQNQPTLNKSDFLIQSVKVLGKNLKSFQKEGYLQISLWRRQNFIHQDINFVITKFETFLSNLFKFYLQRFAVNKKNYQKMYLNLDDCKIMLVETQIRRTKQVLKDLNQMFICAKRLQIQDQKMNGLNFQEFTQMLTRFAQNNWIQSSVYTNYENVLNEKNLTYIPLFLKLQSLLIKLCQKIPFLVDKQALKIIQKGLFQQQLPIILQHIQNEIMKQNLQQQKSQIKDQDKQSQKQVTVNQKKKFKLTLQYIFQELTKRYGEKIVKSQKQIQEEEIVQQN